MAALAQNCFSSVKVCLYMFDPFGETAKVPRLISNLPKIHSLLDLKGFLVTECFIKTHFEILMNLYDKR